MSTPTSHAKPRKIWPWVVGTAILSPIVLIGGAAVVAVSTPTAHPAPPTIGSVPTMPAPIVPPPAPPTTTQVMEVPAFGDGTDYEVGNEAGQVPPGKYHTDGKHTGAVPYASVIGADGHYKQVINIDGPANVWLLQGEKISSHGGVLWVFQPGATKS